MTGYRNETTDYIVFKGPISATGSTAVKCTQTQSYEIHTFFGITEVVVLCKFGVNNKSTASRTKSKFPPWTPFHHCLQAPLGTSFGVCYKQVSKP